MLFSPSGAFLAVLANPVGSPEGKVVITYATAQASTKKGEANGAVIVKSGRGVYQASAEGVPKDVVWVSDYQVLVTVHALQGGSLQKLSAINEFQGDDVCFPPEGTPGPGKLVASAAGVLTLGQPSVVTAAYVTGAARGVLVVLDFDLEASSSPEPPVAVRSTCLPGSQDLILCLVFLQELARYPLDEPPVSVRLPATATEVSLCFEGGGVKVYELPEPSESNNELGDGIDESN